MVGGRIVTRVKLERGELEESFDRHFILQTLKESDSNGFFFILVKSYLFLRKYLAPLYKYFKYFHSDVQKNHSNYPSKS